MNIEKKHIIEANSKLSQQWRVLAAVGGACLICLFCFWYMRLPYLSPTDAMLTGAMGGAYGTGPAQYLCSYHINVLLSVFVYLIRQATGCFNAYPLFLIVHFALVFSFLQVIIPDKWLYRFLVFAAEFLCAYHFTYTVISYMLIGTGMIGLYMLSKEPDKKGSIFSRILCWYLIVTGACLRYNVIFSVMILLLPLLFSKSYRYMLRPAAALIVIWALTVYVINPLAYKISGEVWEQYYQWDTYSLQNRDNALPDPDKHTELLEELGWSENDLRMSHAWLYTDLTVYSADNLKKLADDMTLQELNDLNPFSILKKMIKTSMATAFLGITACALCAFAFARKGIRSVGVRWLLCILTPVLLWAALYVRMRFVTRVAIPLLVLGEIQYMIIASEKTDSDHKADRWINAIATICLICLSVGLIVPQANVYKEQSAKEDMVQRYVMEHSETTYLATSEVLNNMTCNTSVIDFSADRFPINVIRLGSALSFSGGYYNQCEERGIPDPDHLLSNLITDKENILLISGSSSRVKLIKTFLNEHYDFNGEIQAINEISPGVKVYQCDPN